MTAREYEPLHSLLPACIEDSKHCPIVGIQRVLKAHLRGNQPSKVNDSRHPRDRVTGEFDIREIALHDFVITLSGNVSNIAKTQREMAAQQRSQQPPDTPGCAR